MRITYGMIVTFSHTDAGSMPDRGWHFTQSVQQDPFLFSKG